MTESNLSYQDRLSAERAIFKNQVEVHGLPEIHHYWANRHLRPKLEEFGFSTPDDLFFHALRPLVVAARRPLRFLSLGAGNCDMEVRLAERLAACARCDFIIECLDLTPAMLERGREGAHRAGVSGNLEFLTADLNQWKSIRKYDAIIANQSLHHVVNLEHLFTEIQSSLLPGSPFVISDMIGRNGHRRWPEALAIVNEFWRRLPPSYRFNRVLNRFEERFEDWDCSVEGFEGIRSEDILPLLTRMFHFRFFFGFANVIDPFVDRAFGHNFDTSQVWVRRFIDEVQDRDEAEQLAGKVTPTHMLAIATSEIVDQVTAFYPHAPPDCVRAPELEPVELANVEGSYDCTEWLDRVPDELSALARKAVVGQRKVEELSRWGASLDRDMLDRTAWALRLDEEVRQLRQRIRDQEATLVEANTALAELHIGLTASGELIVSLRCEIEERTVWARRLEAEGKQRTEWALSLQQQLIAERQIASQMTNLRPGVRRAYEKARAIWGRVRMLRG